VCRARTWVLRRQQRVLLRTAQPLGGGDPEAIGVAASLDACGHEGHQHSRMRADQQQHTAPHHHATPAHR
jgi:hypothetical protein